MEIGLVRKIDIDKEMQQAYLDYAMSVIVSRALPDARDGLKPVHRRILYAMHEMGLNPDTGYKKSARIVGEVLGKYHPHGDQAVYDAMARMVQDFSLRYPLVDGQGNFGSIDGDPPAAMRYTEAKMAPPARNLLSDIGKGTVDFSPNFDDTLNEPQVLPAALPNLLINGANGIAVGMSTSIPPHNLREVVAALRFMLANWDNLDDVNLDDLLKFVHGPDFPTGGIILQAPDEENGLKSAYGRGRGRITVQAKVHVEEMERGRSRIIVSELPYQTNKASLIERIAKLTRDGKIEGISDLRDESDRQGMRIVIELSKGSDPDTVLTDLYKRTPMRSTFSIITLALVDGEPRLLGLKQALRVFLEHRHTIVARRSEYDLEKAKQRAHILEGLRIAIKNLDEVIATIRRSPDAETARGRLMRKFKLSETQAVAILNMPLRRLASLERKKIEQEYKDLLKTIKELEMLLASPQKMRGVISTELEDLAEAYGDDRRTQIVKLGEGETKTEMLRASDLVPEGYVWVSVTEDGKISRTTKDKPPRLSGKAAPNWLLRVETRDTLFLVAENGKAAALGVHKLPATDSPSDGTVYTQVSPLRSEDMLAAVFNLPPKEKLAENWFALSVTRGGMVKKSVVQDLPGPTAQKIVFSRVNDGDRLGWIFLTNGEQEVLLATAQGMSIRFSEDDVRPMGLVAAGVNGIKLKVGDEVVGAETLPAAGAVFLIRDDGNAKRVQIDQFPTQGRYGLGVQAWKMPAGSRLAGMLIGKNTQRAILHLLKLSSKAVRLDSAPIRSRPARGQVVIDLKKGDKVVSVTTAVEHPRPIEQEKPKRNRSTKKKGAKTNTQGKLL